MQSGSQPERHRAWALFAARVAESLTNPLYAGGLEGVPRWALLALVTIVGDRGWERNTNQNIHLILVAQSHSALVADHGDRCGSSGPGVAGDRPDILAIGLVKELLPGPALSSGPADQPSRLLGFSGRRLAGPARSPPEGDPT